jgi:xanthine dehydrogenase/oxidase
LKTKGPGNYKIPSMGDVPNDFRLHLLDNVPNKHAILRSKAIGEPPLFLGSSVFYAIKDAIQSLREQEGYSGWFVMDSPATCERIRLKCEDEIIKLVTKK